MTQADGKGGSLFDKYLSDPSRRRAVPVDDAPPAPAPDAMPAAAAAAGHNGGPALDDDPDIYPLRLGQLLTGSWFELDFRAYLASPELRGDDDGAKCIWQSALMIAAAEDPAGTLPVEDADLAWLFRKEPAAWRDLRRRGALAGWVEVFVASEDGAEMRLRLAHPRLSKAVVKSVQRIRSKAEGGRRGGATGRSQWKRLRDALVKVGAEDWFLRREDLVEAVQKRLNERGENRAPSNVRAAMLVVLARNEQDGARNVTPFRPLGDKIY